MNDKVYLKSITDANIMDVFKWYNMTDIFKFATGMDRPTTIDALVKMHIEVLASSNEFFLGIYEQKKGTLIGLLKGMLKNEKDGIAWIKLIVVDPSYQRMGYGSSAVSLFLDYLGNGTKVRNVYLTVVEDNIGGIAFWRKQQFSELMRIEKCAAFNDKLHNILIMYRNI